MEAFLTSSITVALAEIGDKTQLLSLLLAARFKNKLAIVAGILVATLLNHFASAWFGSWLSQFLSGGLGKTLLSVSFILMAIWLLFPDKEDEEAVKYHQYGAFIVTTVLFFLAEIGDKTQIATVALAANYENVIFVTVGTTIGMLVANVPVIYAGEAMMKKIPFVYTRVIAGMAFFIVGIFVYFS
jgi:putative Ca2+/H+ antiporter (TMEM165/GDT1 family)